MQVGVGGSARIQGVGNVIGLSDGVTANPAVKKAFIIWSAAVVLLLVFHVGGSRL